jgi:ADP-heptose:LPS heptosyltransferase
MDNRHPSPNRAKYATNLAERALHYLSYRFVNTPVYGFGVLARALKKRPLRTEDFRKKHIRSILVVRVDGLGDIVLMSSFIRALRAGFPDAWITLVVDRKVLRFVEMCPWVNETVGMDEQGFKYKRLFVGWLRAWRTAARLRRDYDLAINPRWDVDSRAATLLGYYSLASWHVGFSERVNANKARINRGLDRMFSHLIDATPGPLHEEDRNNEVLKFLGLQQSRTAPELWLGEDDIEWAEKAIAAQRTGSGGWLVCFGIGGVEAKRLWPAQRFGNVAAWLREKFGASIIVIGGEEDRVAALEMAARIPDTPVMNFAGACSMRRSAALLRHCDLFVGTDSGPMHMADTLILRTVTNPSMFPLVCSSPANGVHPARTVVRHRRRTASSKSKSATFKMRSRI